MLYFLRQYKFLKGSKSKKRQKNMLRTKEMSGKRGEARRFSPINGPLHVYRVRLFFARGVECVCPPRQMSGGHGADKGASRAGPQTRGRTWRPPCGHEMADIWRGMGGYVFTNGRTNAQKNHLCTRDLRA